MAAANISTTVNRGINELLPPEVLEKIFEFCNVNDGLLNLVNVCQQWRDIIYQRMTEVNVELRGVCDINDLITLLSRAETVTKLRVVCNQKYSDIGSYDLLNTGTPGVTLNVTSLNHRLESFQYIANSCRGYHPLLGPLLTVVLQTSTQTLTTFELHVNKNGCDDIGTQVAQVLNACRHLRHLTLNIVKEHRQRFGEIIPTLTHLESLAVRGEYFGVPRLSHIADMKRRCINLRSIRITSLELRAEDDLTLLQFISYIGHLRIVGLDSDQLWSVVRQLRECSDLGVEKLYVSCAGHLTDDILLALVQALRDVEFVEASGCQHLTNEGVVNLITSSEKLEYIDVFGVKNINDGLIQLLDDVTVSRDVTVIARYNTTLSLSGQMTCVEPLSTGRNKNISVEYDVIDLYDDGSSEYSDSDLDSD